MLGEELSSPVKTTVHVALFPFPSFVVTVTVCVVPSPDANKLPIVGF